MGDGHIVGTLAAPFVVPATNQTVNVTLTSVYTGPQSTPVTINGNRYTIVPDPTIPNAKLTKLYDTRATIPVSSLAMVIPSQIAVLLNNLAPLTTSTLVPVSFPSSGSGNTTLTPGGTVTIGSDSFNVNAVVHAGTWELGLNPVFPPNSSHLPGRW